MITENSESIPNQSSSIQMIKGLLRPCGCSRYDNMDPKASHSHLCLHLHGTARLFRHLCRFSQQPMQQNLRPALQDVKLSPLKLEDFTTAEPTNPFPGKRTALGKALPWKSRDESLGSSMATRLLEAMCGVTVQAGATQLNNQDWILKVKSY